MKKLYILKCRFCLSSVELINSYPPDGVDVYQLREY